MLLGRPLVRRHWSAGVWWAALLAVGAVALSLGLTPPHVPTLRNAHALKPQINWLDGVWDVKVPPHTSVRYTVDGSWPTATSPVFPAVLGATAPGAARLVHTPTSPQWRPPVGEFPQLAVLSACVQTAMGTLGPVAVATSFPKGEHTLPVVSLVLPEGAFFQADSGIYVPGLAVLRQQEEVVHDYSRDQRWWKYPGNYLFRGKAWERAAHWSLRNAAGVPEIEGPVRVRIHGNNTRGFPQHALRLGLAHPTPIPLFPGDRTGGYTSVVLRAGGNDGDRTFLRDALQHELCAGLPFATSTARYAVLYVNGAYWGLHDLRQRVDENELARRYALRAQEITVLEDAGTLYHGSEDQSTFFMRFLARLERMDATHPSFVDSVQRCLDADGFLAYMAAQMICGNRDWPDQNVKWWRHHGMVGSGAADGRWRWVMGDSDMGMGYLGTAQYNMFAHVQARAGPTARLFRCLVRNAGLRDHFVAQVQRLLGGPLASARMVARVDLLARSIEGEMPMHVRRWRRPQHMDAWRTYVGELRSFAAERETAVKGHLTQWLKESL
jgi:CotH kinase protein